MKNRQMMGMPSAYAGGYSETIKRRLESVNLPDKVKCKTCKKYRVQSAFSKRQLEILRNAVVVEGPHALNGGHANCRNCTGVQTMELRCRECDQVKGTSEFAIGQRKAHEDARCLSCVQGQADAEPVLDENKMLTEGEISTTGTVTASHVGGDSLAESRRLTLSDAPGYSRGSLYEDDDDDDDDDDNASVGGVWVEPDRHDTNSSKGKGLNPSGYGYNSRGLANLDVSDAMSVRSRQASWNVQGSVVAATNVRPNGEGRKFARVPAWKAEVQEKPPTRVPEITKYIAPSDDEDDEEGLASYL
ncbi:Stc1 domain-containing protein [Aspergillus cavernicola]|uniref:Stc1 domain-containing protein n=1 Tax=Aspergillus cavernicola TaxID=176166 RepID=A0ABR4IBR5_9EURO